MSDITILGAGLAGLSCAYHLKRDYKIYEKELQVGGLCRSEKIDNFIFDYDGHLLHFKDEYTKKLVYELLNGKLIQHKRRAFIYSDKIYTEYPFQAKLHGLPTSVIKKCLIGLIKARASLGKKAINFKQWILSNFGKGIAKYFMMPYNEKFWTIPLEDLTAEWIDGFIPLPSLRQALLGSFGICKKEFGYNPKFYYPADGGINEIPKAFTRKINSIYTSKRAVRVDLNNKNIEFEDKDKVGYGKIVSTIPLPELANILDPLPKELSDVFSKLKFTSIYVLNLGIKRKNINSSHWVYFPSSNFPFYRIGFPHNFSKNLTPRDYSSIYAEVAYSKYMPIDKNSIQEKIIDELIKLNIIHSRDEIVTSYPIDIKYGYVIYDKNYKQVRRNIINFLNNNNIYSIGRYGSWQYQSMEDALLDGRKLAGNLNKIKC